MPSLSPKEIWDIHLQGDSNKAAKLAKTELDGIDTKNFTDFTRAIAHAEYSRSTLVTATAAVKRSENWEQAQEGLGLSLATALQHFPLAEQMEEASLRGDYFEATLGSESAQLICLRDVLHLSRIIAQIFPDEEVADFAAGLQHLLGQISDEKRGERFSLIFLCEEAPYPQAKQAYVDFLHSFGPASEKMDANQLITVSARMLGRAVTAKDFIQTAGCLDILLKSLKNHSELRMFLLKELTKNLSENYRDQHLQEKYQSWQSLAKQDLGLQKQVEQLLKNVFVGMGQQQVRKINKL